MKKTIYYLTSDYVSSEDGSYDVMAKGSNNDVEVLDDLCRKGYAVKYSSVEDFVEAFNNEYISDLGYLIYI